MANEAIRSRIKRAGLKNYEVAKAIGISSAWFSVLLREELTGERKSKVNAAIRELKKQKKEGASNGITV